MNNSAFSRVKAKVVRFINEVTRDENGKIKFNKRNKIIIASVIVAVIVVVSGSLALRNTQVMKNLETQSLEANAYKVYFGGVEVGIVRNSQEATQVLQEIQKELIEKNDMDIAIDQDLSFESVNVDEEALTLTEKLKKNIKNNMTYEIYASALYIDGKRIGAMESEEQAEKLLEEVKETYVGRAREEGSEIEEILIVENVEIKREKTPISSVYDYQEMLDLVQKGTTEKRVHKVARGESYWGIANKYDLSVDDLVSANPDKDSTLIHPGDELNLIVPKPYLTVETYENQIFRDKIDFNKEVKYTSSLYSDQKTVQKAGVYGEKEVFAKVIRHNGVEVEKEVMKEVVISDPKVQVELQGTKALPPKKGTGIFMRPTRGTLTSRFGARWGRMHYGVDLASRIGTPIKAADGGVVTFAGWKGTYGYMVEIDHGAGFTTRYGHCSKIYVKVGEKVYKDKTIAAVGNTGRSTGPHVHFEVRKHGVPQNPLNYIGKQYR
ncbi:peptidoglycan DD-metalloendopeptidase family protein [Sporosalibacterium faouarense]|uniref:peptidoglycan DD-metalloendopeptidase family protein n=1 Tax=Sporosalibacterium faouarense TaxID=516123 RepID=UPI00141D3826|nr:M23 family metallopeptidase [Sporosalibacterium faouarense]MTI46235.1 M23 family metallopeptidase [Bacillota bacterium]